MPEKRTTLEDYLELKARGKNRGKVLREIYEEVQSSKLKLIDPIPPKSFGSYLSRPEYSLWLWTAFSIIALAIASVLISPYFHPISYLRYVIGSIYLLFLPGYATVELLYPQPKELSPLERLALSIGLSLALIPLIGLLLNYSPWGIRLEPILASTSLYSSLALFSAAYRKYSFIYKRVKEL